MICTAAGDGVPLGPSEVTVADELAMWDRSRTV